MSYEKDQDIDHDDQVAFFKGGSAGYSRPILKRAVLDRNDEKRNQKEEIDG